MGITRTPAGQDTFYNEFGNEWSALTQWWEKRDTDGLDSVDVRYFVESDDTIVEVDGVEIGRIYKAMTSFDRKPAGQRYVTSRTTSNRWYIGGHQMRGFDYRTRREAVAKILGDRSRAATENES